VTEVLNQALIIDELWDFNDPAASEARFRDAHAKAAMPVDAMELLTQVARAQGLQRKFDEAHATLDTVERELSADDNRVRVRLALERGRVFTSAGDRELARPHFDDAWQRARSAQLDALAVDAAHMLAIVAEGDDALQWNQRASDIAAASEDSRARRWVASLHNNLGWTHHERGDFDTALHHFQVALDAQEKQDKPREVLIARWCVARCLRSLGRVTEALAEQQALLLEWDALGEADGHVHEELAECLQALGRADEAQQHRDRARALLSP
jgi:tetratricopeptide (TPR) repeat protein